MKSCVPERYTTLNNLLFEKDTPPARRRGDSPPEDALKDAQSLLKALN
jgi:hypothetical protein